MTPHNEAKKGEIAKIVLMPGDPVRAKYIAENFLEDAKLVNTIRNMFAYTGKYKGKKITVMAHGMGIPSAGLYIYELYKFYDVECIIRIGSCGALKEGIDLFDIILSERSYTESNFALTANNEVCYLAEATKEVNNIIEGVAKENKIKYIKGDTLCNDFFDKYLEDISVMLGRVSEKVDLIGAEMEVFALFYLTKMFNRKSACILTVVDSMSDKREATAEERATSLNDMIKLALEATLKM